MTIENGPYPRVTEIMKITDTPEGNGVYKLNIKIQYAEAEQPVEEEFTSRPNDPYGVNPQIRQWMSANPNAPVHVYTGPTIDETRASMPPLSARQLRLGLVDAGISVTQVESTIAAMPAGMDRDKAQIEWEFATEFKRNHPLLLNVGAALGLTPEQIDTMWLASADL